VKRERKDHPLHSALAAAEAAIKSDSAPAARVAAALLILADGLATMLAASDVSSTRVSAIPGTNQALRRLGVSQDRRIAEIRIISSQAKGAASGELRRMSKKARASTKAALRTQVRKLRLRRRSDDDGPGGEA
jgi:hypothetical protein